MKKSQSKKSIYLVALSGLIILLSVLVPTSTYSQSSLPQPGSRISLNQAQQLLAGTPQAVLIDVRTQEEFNAGYIPGAFLLPNTSITTQSASQIIPALDFPVVVYCRSGARSAQATRTLMGLGYTRVYDLGPITAWTGSLATHSTTTRN